MPHRQDVAQGVQRSLRRERNGSAGDGCRLRDEFAWDVAGGLGFEPRLTESESAVLPLDDPPNLDHAAGIEEG